MGNESQLKQQAEKANVQRRTAEGAWVCGEFPDDDICVIVRTTSPDWPLLIGFRDAGEWRELSADPIDHAIVTGWMHMDEAAKRLDNSKGGVS